MRQTTKVTTEILCPAGCQTTVLQLSSGEAVRVAENRVATSKVAEGKCPKCHAPFRIPVSAE